MTISFLTHFFKHLAVLGSILARLKGCTCHIWIPPTKTLGKGFVYLGEMNNHWIYNCGWSIGVWLLISSIKSFICQLVVV